MPFDGTPTDLKTDVPVITVQTPEGAKPLVEVLEHVRALLTSPRHWTKGTYYSRGRYCMIGAFMHVTGKLTNHEVFEQNLLLDGRPLLEQYKCVPDFNDDQKVGHLCVLSCLDESIERLRLIS